MPSTPFSNDVRADIQGFLISGYGHLSHAAYMFLQVRDAVRAQRWLRALTATVTSARPWPLAPDGGTVKPALALNAAFTAAGLDALGVPRRVLCTFPAEFQEGMTHTDRSSILGDVEESHPVAWELGGPTTPAIHVVLLVHAELETGLAEACDAQRALLGDTAGGVVELGGSVQTGYRPDRDYEPFGFRDGISQPSIAGITGDGVPTGEFILGYENHFQVIPPAPVVPADLDPEGRLPPLNNPYYSSAPMRDLGINGSFVVYRKLQQDVAGFWQFMMREALRTMGADDARSAVDVAARCVGRWPSGAPLMLSPESDAPALGGRDDFMYRDDPAGVACPIGAHIRRANPRDDIKPYTAAQSLSMSEAHRLLRRARVFGPASVSPEVLSEAAADGRDLAQLEPLALADQAGARGIHFFCVNASISRQFEFVQQTWCNNPRFGGLNDNKDPLVGDNARGDQPASHMTIPRRLRHQRSVALPRFVTVKGGAYLFMPSLTALRWLGECSSSDDGLAGRGL